MIYIHIRVVHRTQQQHSGCTRCEHPRRDTKVGIGEIADAATPRSQQYSFTVPLGVVCLFKFATLRSVHLVPPGTEQEAKPTKANTKPIQKNAGLIGKRSSIKIKNLLCEKFSNLSFVEFLIDVSSFCGHIQLSFPDSKPSTSIAIENVVIWGCNWPY